MVRAAAAGPRGILPGPRPPRCDAQQAVGCGRSPPCGELHPRQGLWILDAAGVVVDDAGAAVAPGARHGGIRAVAGEGGRGGIQPGAAVGERGGEGVARLAAAGLAGRRRLWSTAAAGLAGCLALATARPADRDDTHALDGRGGHQPATCHRPAGGLTRQPRQAAAGATGGAPAAAQPAWPARLTASRSARGYWG